MTEAPNYTQVPNTLLGDIERGNVARPGSLAEMKEGELKLYLVLCRLTIGYHQGQRRASLSLLQKMTGLSRQAVVTAADALEGRGLIERHKAEGVTLWQMLVKNLDYRLVKNLDQTSQKFRPPSKKETKKETIQEEEKKFGEILKYLISLKIQKAPAKDICGIFAEAGIVTLEGVKDKMAAHLAALGPSDTVGLVVHRLREGMIDPPELPPIEDESVPAWYS